MSLFPTKSQAEVLLAHGLFPFAYAVLGENEHGIIVRHIISYSIKFLRKANTQV